MVHLYKESFGRGPTKVRTTFAGPDTVVVVLEGAFTVADRTLVHVPAAGHVLPPHTAPVRAGWAFSVLVTVPDPPD